MIYPEQLGNCLALCRVADGLSASERRSRLRQIRRSFRPGLIRQTFRWLRNIVNMFRDAFSKALTAIIGSLAKTRPGMVGGQQGQVTEIGKTLLGATANAYEPILERHIGKPVVVRVAGSADSPTAVPFEMQGYLVDYSESYLAVFNTEHEPIESVNMELEASQEQAAYRVNLEPEEVIVFCKGPEALVVESIYRNGQEHQLAVSLLPGCSLNLRRPAGAAIRLQMQVTRRLDLVCPRTTATVHFGAETAISASQSHGGVAPEALADQSESMPS